MARAGIPVWEERKTAQDYGCVYFSSCPLSSGRFYCGEFCSRATTEQRVEPRVCGVQVTTGEWPCLDAEEKAVPLRVQHLSWLQKPAGHGCPSDGRVVWGCVLRAREVWGGGTPRPLHPHACSLPGALLRALRGCVSVGSSQVGRVRVPFAVLDYHYDQHYPNTASLGWIHHRGSLNSDVSEAEMTSPLLGHLPPATGC